MRPKRVLVPVVGNSKMTATVLTRALSPPEPLVPAHTALFLDLDGTLAPIAPRPQDVAPDPRRTALVRRASQVLDGRLAVVSGRTLADIDHILDHAAPVVCAVHGLVTRTGAGVDAARADPALDHARRVLADFAARDPSLMIEDKGLSLAVHYRLAPEHEGPARRVVADLAAELGWVVQPGRAVAELRPPGPTKADSVRRLMAQAPFAGATPVFVGDDLTDEDGFVAATGLGGYGVVVGARRRTAARHRLGGVAAVLDWLEASLP